VIKFVIAAIWICAATLGAVFYAFQAAGAKSSAAAEHADAASMMGGLDYVKTEVISVPLIRNSVIDGYFLTRLVYTVDPRELAKLTVPAESIITDVVYSYVYSAPEIDFTKYATLNLDAFRNGIRDRINERVKQKLVAEVLIEQIDYLSKNEIRDNSIRRRASTNKGSPVPAAAEGEQKPAH